jgi:Restriction endonuclease BglII
MLPPMAPAESLIPANIQDLYEIHEWRHASAVLASDFPGEWHDILDVLASFQLKKSAVAVGGGNKSAVSRLIDSQFYARGWEEKHFDTRITIDADSYASPTHSVDCYKNRIALEIEWNNKDPFFDRDLNNFRLLFELRVVSVGVIITRCDALQKIFDDLGRGPSYGMSTTHMSKLLPKIEGGGGGGCPILVFGITTKLYDAMA